MRSVLSAALLCTALAAVLPTTALAAVEAPNAVNISPRLDTSGQPKREFLEKLKAEGYEVVIYLAPPTVPDAVADEPMVFLDRVIRLKEKPDKAYESVHRAWDPDPVWKKFIVDTLKANGIAYEPL